MCDDISKMLFYISASTDKEEDWMNIGRILLFWHNDEHVFYGE